MLVRNIIAILIMSWIVSPVSGQGRARDSAAVGGVAGAVIGGIIGHQNDETPEGALIGGAVGAIAGGLLGRQQEADLQRQQQAQQQAYYQQQQQAYAQQQQVVASGVSAADIVTMNRSGVSESLIMSHLQTKGVQRHLEVSEIISLHQQGVGDNLIAAYQSAPLATQVAQAARPPVQQVTNYQSNVYSPQPVVVRQPSVIVHEPVIYHRSPVYYDYHPRPVHRHHHSHGASFRFGF